MLMKLKYLLVVLVCTLPLACGHSNKGTAPVTPVEPEEPDQTVSDITTYITTADATQLFVTLTSDFTKAGSMSPNQVKFAEDPTAPEVDGFGLAVTTASCYNLLKMSKDDRTKFLTDLFSKTEGVGSSLILSLIHI